MFKRKGIQERWSAVGNRSLLKQSMLMRNHHFARRVRKKPGLEHVDIIRRVSELRNAAARRDRVRGVVNKMRLHLAGSDLAWTKHFKYSALARRVN